MEMMEQLKKSRLIAVIALKDANNAVPLAQALLKGGVSFLEITFRNSNAKEALMNLKNANIPIYYGAGTVRTLTQAQDALEAGAHFIVSPGFNPSIVKWALDHNIVIFPGIDSTFGIEQAYAIGITTVKFFPAEQSGGIPWLKAVKGPYFDITFMPTGGVGMENLSDYLALSNVLSVGGSFIAPNNLIESQDFDRITEISAQAVSIVKEVEKNGKS